MKFALPKVVKEFIFGAYIKALSLPFSTTLVRLVNSFVAKTPPVSVTTNILPVIPFVKVIPLAVIG